jgi:hypothetical protein
VSNNPKRRLQEHRRDSKKNSPNNPYLARIFNKNSNQLIQTILYTGDLNECYQQEEQYRPKKYIGWNINKGGSYPPSRLGWSPTTETIEKRSKKLTGIVRTEEWCEKLSKAKQGSNNPMFGRKIPCNEERRKSILYTKNVKYYDFYKKAITLINEGKSCSALQKELGLNKGVYYRLKKRTHNIFLFFPDLAQSTTC